jgi:hypothetical protein
MRKLLVLFAVLAFGFLLASCKEKVDPATEDLQSAYDSLSALIADPTNITGGFEVPTTLYGNVTATWTSSNPGVVTVGAANNGFANITVNRPAFGQPNVNVTLSVVLSIPSELDAKKTLTKDWSVVLTIVANTVEEITIDSVADILALKDPAYSKTYQVSLQNMTIFAKGDTTFAYDGTGIIQVYSGNQANLVKGKVYTIDATIEWYFGIWELTKWTAVEQTTATPQYPTKEIIESVNTKIDALIAANEHTYAGKTASAGNMEPIYATVTGKVYMIPGDTGNYNTYIVDTAYDTTQDWVPGSAEAPGRGFMVYYGTNDFTTLRLYNGITVTIDVVIYTYRSNNQAFAIYYVGGPEGIDATLTDAQKLEIDSNAVSLPEAMLADGTLSLPATGANGSTIVWSFTNAENADNSLINLTTGAVTVPVGRQTTVGLTATISYGALTPVVKTFNVKLGEYPVSTIADVRAATTGTFRIQGVVIGYIANNTIAIQDATGGISVFKSTGVADLAALIGHTVDLIGTRGAFGGLIQLTNHTVIDLGEATLPAAFNLQTVAEWNATTLLPYQSTRVNLTNMKITAWTDANFSNIEMTLLDETTGNTINFKWDSRVTLPELDFLKATKVGDYVTFSGAALGWASNNPLLTITHGNQIAAGTAPVLTDANYVTLDQKALTIVTAYNADGTITLPVAGTNGSTISWAFTDAEDEDNALIDLVAGTITLPAQPGTVQVSLTATLTKGTETATKVFVVSISKAEPTPELFFSEYIEGSSNNKALEIYNPTNQTVDLTQYKVVLYSNGAATYSNNITLTGTLAPGEVFVIINPSTTGVDPLLTAAGDVSSNVTFYNGDDAIALIKIVGTEEVIIDVIGIIGEDPGTHWVVGTGSTLDYTLVRNANVTYGTSIWDPTQWTVYPNNTFTYLGSHTSVAPAPAE